MRGDAIRASSTMPIFFEPVNFGSMSLIDGGTFSILNFHEAIHRCREHGFEDKDIIIDIIACFDMVKDIP